MFLQRRVKNGRQDPSLVETKRMRLDALLIGLSSELTEMFEEQVKTA